MAKRLTSRSLKKSIRICKFSSVSDSRGGRNIRLFPVSADGRAGVLRLLVRDAWTVTSSERCDDFPLPADPLGDLKLFRKALTSETKGTTDRYRPAMGTVEYHVKMKIRRTVDRQNVRQTGGEGHVD